MSDAEREMLEKIARGQSEMMMPVASDQALNLIIVHALRDNAAAMREMRDTVGEMKDKMVRWEAHVKKLDAIEVDVKLLMDEKQRRAGMQWLVEWVAKYVPWLAAAAAAVWALRVSPR